MIQGASISDSKDPNVVNVIKSNLIALVDTGADMCAIDEDLANHLTTLIPIRQVNERGATGGRVANVYYLQIIVPNENISGKDRFQVECVSSPLKGQGLFCDLLLGEDVIQHFELHLNRSHNEWTLTKAE